MKNYINDAQLVLAVGTALVLAGCATPHYKVTDPQSGNTYFTEEIDSSRAGAVKLKDGKTGAMVTLQNSEVHEISSEEYKKGLAEPAKPAAAPAAATAPAPAPAPGATAAPAPAAAPAPGAPAAPAHTAAPAPAPK